VASPATYKPGTFVISYSLVSTAPFSVNAHPSRAARSDPWAGFGGSGSVERWVRGPGPLDPAITPSISMLLRTLVLVFGRKRDWNVR
jgi:hypothetical protein